MTCKDCMHFDICADDDEPCERFRNKAYFVESKTIAQIKWERDTAIEQLKSYGIGFCEKADVVKVVRCKDCKYSYFVKSCSKYECRKGCGTLKYSNDFCSYGERSRQ